MNPCCLGVPASLAALSAVLHPTLAAQRLNPLEHQVGPAVVASRGALGTDGGWLVKRIEDHVAVGNGTAGGRAAAGELGGVRVVIQNNESIIAHPFRVAVLAGDPADPRQPVPAPTPADLLVDFGTMHTPALAHTGPVAWLFTLTLATPARTLPVDHALLLGVEFEPASPGSPTAALELHVGRLPAGSRAPDQLLSLPRSRPRVSSSPEIARLEVLTRRPVLEAGAFRPATGRTDYGPAGQHPDTSHAVSLRIRQRNQPTTTAVVAASLGPRGAPPVPVPALGGWLGLPPSQQLAGPVAVERTDHAGEIGIPGLVPAGVAPAGLQVTLQALLVPVRGAPELTNAVDVHWR